jgi:uncharacterized protein DUF5069
MTSLYPRSPHVQLGGLAHLARMIDKIRLRHAGHIQDYNYLTVGFDKHLLDFLELEASAFEQRVCAGGTDAEIVEWVLAHMRSRSQEEIAQWNQRITTSGPKDDAAHARFHRRLEEIAKKRGVQVSALPRVTTWADVIELDEDRL